MKRKKKETNKIVIPKEKYMRLKNLDLMLIKEAMEFKVILDITENKSIERI